MSASLVHRIAGADDLALLAGWNRQLIEDEGHRNAMTVGELEARMRGWLAGEYTAVVFERDAEPVAYALYRESEREVCLRQFFVRRECRRQGIGRSAMRVLLGEVWPERKRRTVEVLCHNEAGVAFWRAVGYKDYCLTLEVFSGLHRRVLSRCKHREQRLGPRVQTEGAENPARPSAATKMLDTPMGTDKTDSTDGTRAGS